MELVATGCVAVGVLGDLVHVWPMDRREAVSRMKETHRIPGTPLGPRALPATVGADPETVARTPA